MITDPIPVSSAVLTTAPIIPLKLKKYGFIQNRLENVDLRFIAETQNYKIKYFSKPKRKPDPMLYYGFDYGSGFCLTKPN